MLHFIVDSCNTAPIPSSSSESRDYMSSHDIITADCIMVDRTTTNETYGQRNEALKSIDSRLRPRSLSASSKGSFHF